MHQYQLNMVQIGGSIDIGGSIHIGGSMHVGRFANVNIDNILSARLKRRLTGLEKQAIQNSDSTDWLFSENICCFTEPRSLPKDRLNQNLECAELEFAFCKNRHFISTQQCMS